MPILLRSINVPLRRPLDQLRARAAAAGSASSRRPSASSHDVLSRQLSHQSSNVPSQSAVAVPELSLFEQIKDLYRRWNINLLIPLFFILVYMVFGAVIFYFLESGDPPPSPTHEEHKRMLLRRLDEIFDDRAARRRSARRNFMRDAVEHFEKEAGLSAPKATEWTFTTAMYFAGTLFTTIGYGDVACSTVWGRAFTVVYSVVGIPIMLITLNDLGKFLYALINGCVKGADQLTTSLGIFSLFGIFKKTPQEEESRIPDVEAQVEIDSFKSEHGSLQSLADLEENKTPRMSVKTALSITISWIFICAGLFKLWEDWTYGESLYFMYISLSTIGLGDVSVSRKDLMVLCFVFVIIGLSLVSMSISVVQSALEDFYINLIMKLIMDYQEKMAQGGDEMGASVGMMRMFGSNRAAKLLMPLLSKEKKRYAMEKVEERAKESGFELPPILSDLDEKTGMPKIFAIKEETKAEEGEEYQPPPELEKLVMKQQILAEEAALVGTPLPHVVSHHALTQTEILLWSEKGEQTDSIRNEERDTQTDLGPVAIENRDTQTEYHTYEVMHTQTERVTMTDATTTTATERVTTNEAATTTETVISMESTQQTDQVQTLDQELQTYLVELLDAETYMDIEYRNIRLQTQLMEILERAIQTEDLSGLSVDPERKSPSKMVTARRRIRRAFAKREDANRRKSLGDQVGSDGKDSEDQDVEGEGSYESLHWDPVDGMHAEKQLPVKRLKSFFEQPASPSTRKSSIKSDKK